MRQAIVHFALALMCVSAFSRITQADETSPKIYAWIDEAGTPVFSNISASPRDWLAAGPAHVKNMPGALQVSPPSLSAITAVTEAKLVASNSLTANCPLTNKIESRTDANGYPVFSDSVSELNNGHINHDRQKTPAQACKEAPIIMLLPDQGLLAEMDAGNNGKISGNLAGDPHQHLPPDQHDALQDH